MGSMMALHFIEHGCRIVVEDPSERSLKAAMTHIQNAGLQHLVSVARDPQDVCAKLDRPRLILFSVPQGQAADTLIKQLLPHMDPGDIIIDAGNEHWERTQRRQGVLAARGCYYVGMGVSGGYQSARSGPSLCPGGEAGVLERLMPFLEDVAAKDGAGRPCVAPVGAGGAGHYVKMIHNGIEHGMMGGLCEVWAMMKDGLGMSYAEIGDVLERWGRQGELVGSTTCAFEIMADIVYNGRAITSSSPSVQTSAEQPTLQTASTASLIGSRTRLSRTMKRAKEPDIGPLRALPICTVPFHR